MPVPGIDPAKLGDEALLRELETIHRTRHDTLLYGSADALSAHNARMAALEGEYLRRHPERHVARSRTRSGARARTCQNSSSHPETMDKSHNYR